MQYNSNATADNGFLDIKGYLRVTGNAVQDSGGADNIRFDGSQNSQVMGQLKIQDSGNIGEILDSSDNKMILFNGGNLVLSASGGTVYLQKNDAGDACILEGSRNPFRWAVGMAIVFS